MFKLASKAIEIAGKHGADFGDIRIVEARTQTVAMKNGELGGLDDQTTLGYGVRVLYKGAWGFASGSVMTERGVADTALKAIAIAKASRLLMAVPVRLAPEPAYTDIWQTPFLKDPFLVPVEDKLAILSRADALMRKSKKVRVTSSEMNFFREHQWHMTTEGSRIEQVLLHSGASMTATAVENGQSQLRGYPCSHGGQTLSGGWEIIEAMNLEDHAQRVGEEAAALLSAPVCPAGTRDLIISGNRRLRRRRREGAALAHREGGRPLRLHDQPRVLRPHRPETQLGLQPRRRLLQYPDHPHLQPEPDARLFLHGRAGGGDQGRRDDGEQRVLEHRPEAPELPVRLRDRLAHQERQKGPHGKESHLPGHYPRVLGLLRRHCGASRVAPVGSSQLRQGPAGAAGHDVPRLQPRALPQGQDRGARLSAAAL